MNKTITSIIAVVALIVGVIGGHVFWGQSLVGGASAVGTSNSTQRIAQLVCNNVATTTYASFLNSDAQDRVITSVDFFFTGYGNSPFSSLSAGTSTGVAGTSATLVFNAAIATTTDPTYVSTSTPSATVGSRVWAAGSYLNFFGNATSAGNCVIKVAYIAE